MTLSVQAGVDPRVPQGSLPLSSFLGLEVGDWDLPLSESLSPLGQLLPATWECAERVICPMNITDYPPKEGQPDCKMQVCMLLQVYMLLLSTSYSLA
jgi:hypothetical protein